MPDLSEVTLETKIAVPRDYSSRVNIYHVTSLTSKQIICGNIRIRTSDGLVLGTGGDVWHRQYAHIATEQDLLLNRIESVTNRIFKVKITKENLEAAETFLKSLKQKG